MKGERLYWGDRWFPNRSRKVKNKATTIAERIERI